MNQMIKPQPYCKNCRLAPPTLSDDKVQELEAIIKPGHLLHKGDFVFRQGDPFHNVYLVRSGSIKTFTTNEQGLEKITGFYFATEIFGFSGMGEGSYPVSAQALESTLCSEIPFHQLEELSIQIPGLSHQIMLMMSRNHGVEKVAVVLAALATILALTLVALLAAGPLMRLLGARIEAVITRILGVLLGALAVQFVIDGIRISLGLS